MYNLTLWSVTILAEPLPKSFSYSILHVLLFLPQGRESKIKLLVVTTSNISLVKKVRHHSIHNSWDHLDWPWVKDCRMPSSFGLHHEGFLCDPLPEEDNGQRVDDKDCTPKSSLSHTERTKYDEFFGHSRRQKKNAEEPKIHNSRRSTTHTLSFLAFLERIQTLQRMPRKLKEVEVTSPQKWWIITKEHKKGKDEGLKK